MAIALGAVLLWSLAGRFSRGLLAFSAAGVGFLIRSGEVLERVEGHTTVVIDRTGILTRGSLALTTRIPCGER